MRLTVAKYHRARTAALGLALASLSACSETDGPQGTGPSPVPSVAGPAAAAGSNVLPPNELGMPPGSGSPVTVGAPGVPPGPGAGPAPTTAGPVQATPGAEPAVPGPADSVVPEVEAVEGAVVVGEPLHRLNRLEYNNTVRDLLDASSDPANIFPPDPSLDGFDNIADGLTLSSTLLSLYADAARQLAAQSLDVQPRFWFNKLAKEVATGGHAIGSRGWSLYDAALKPPPGNGDVHDLTVEFELAQAERVTVSIHAGGTASRTDMPEMGARIDDLPKHSFNVDNPVASPQAYTFSEDLPAGKHRLLITFDNFLHRPTKNTVNSLIFQELEIRSEETALPASRAKIETCDPRAAADPGACYQEMVTAFARRAWRRPLTGEENTRLVGLWDQLSSSEGEEAALQLALRAILVSPQFIYRASRPLAGAAPMTAGGPVPLGDFSLASRLSYFIWSSMPDEELLGAAQEGQLRRQESLAQQVGRMLADPKSRGLLDGFAAQWLSSRKLANANPDPEVFPEFDHSLRAAMQQETLAFFGDFISNGQPLGALLTPDFGYLNDRLAEHYGLELPGSDELVRVPRGPGDRRGLVMLGAWLTAQSESTATSPVLRGRWLTERVMCVDVPPPPAVIAPSMEAPEDATVRERLAAHRADPQCVSCHTILDPPGLGLEEFDAVGRQRDTENGSPVDTSGGIPGGPEFVGGEELAEALKQDPRVYRCLTRKLATYALGRRLVATDEELLSALVASLDANSTTVPQLLERLVLSPAFRMVTPGATAPAIATEHEEAN